MIKINAIEESIISNFFKYPSIDSLVGVINARCPTEEDETASAKKKRIKKLVESVIADYYRDKFEGAEV